MRLEFDGFVRGAPQPKTPHHGAHVHQHLEHRNVLADAMARAHRKGNVGESMPFLGIDAGKTLGLNCSGSLQYAGCRCSM